MSKIVLSTKGNLGNIKNRPLVSASPVARASSVNRVWNDVCSSSDGTKLAAVDASGLIYTSADSGVTWTSRFISKTWSKIACSDDGTKLAALALDFVYTSTDSGVNWTQRIATSGGAMASSSDGAKLLVSGNDTNLYTSTDSGANWTQRSPNSSWKDAASSSNGNVLVAIDINDIWISTDSGANWTSTNVTSTFLVSVDMSSSGSTIFVLDNGLGKVHLSTDTGATWNAIWTFAESPVSVSCSANATICAVVTGSGYIYISRDSGRSWVQRDSTARAWKSSEVSGDGTLFVGGGDTTNLYTLSPLTYNAGMIELGESDCVISPTGTSLQSAALLHVPQPSFRSSSNVTAAIASALFLEGPPNASTNTTITTPYSLYVKAGNSFAYEMQSRNFDLPTTNTGTSATSTNAVNLNDNPLLLRGTGHSDTNHYIMYANISGNTFASQAVDGPAVVGFGGGILGSSNGNTWAMKWATDTSTTFNGTATFTGALVTNGTLTPSRAGSTSSTTGTIYSNPASTAFSGSNSYTFNVFNTPTTTGSTTGTAATVSILGAPANATTSYALNVVSGTVNMAANANVAGILRLTGTGSTNTAQGTLRSDPASTAFSGSNNYFFNVFATPTTTGSTTGTAATVSIHGSPPNATNSYSLRVLAGATSLEARLFLSGTGNTTSSAGTFYSSPASTAFSGSSNYFFNVFDTPTTTGSTTGIASTVAILGAPANATTPYALRVAAGSVSLLGAGSTSSTIGTFYSSPASTAFTGANDYFFNVFNTPTTTGTTNGTAATVRISGPPAGANASWALHVATGAVLVEGSANGTFSYGWFNSAGQTGTSSGTNPYSIIAISRIAASEFNATSSRKIKNIEKSAMDPDVLQEVLDAYSTIELYKYQYKDINDGDEAIYGVVAEELLKNPITARYVKHHRRYVPNIYQMATVFDDQTLILEGAAGQIEESAKLLIWARNERIELHDFDIVDKKIIRIATQTKMKPGEFVFVYGTEELCPTVTKNHLFEMNMVVTQYLLREVAAMKKMIVHT